MAEDNGTKKGGLVDGLVERREGDERQGDIVQASQDSKTQHLRWPSKQAFTAPEACRLHRATLRTVPCCRLRPSVFQHDAHPWHLVLTYGRSLLRGSHCNTLACVLQCPSARNMHADKHLMQRNARQNTRLCQLSRRRPQLLPSSRSRPLTLTHSDRPQPVLCMSAILLQTSRVLIVECPH